jgi:branched-chain amino acid transport system ATP-binding protein
MAKADGVHLNVDKINVFYGNIHALNNVSLKVDEGQIVSMVGANGAGKSTLLMTLAGVLKAKTGSVTFDGAPLPDAPHRVLAAGICLVPERRRLYANLTVRENLMMGAHLRKNKSEINEDLERMMDLFPIIRERVKQYAGTLSGGEQQMVAIARGLMGRPKLLLMDEPSLGLAPLIIQQVFDTVAGLKQQGITILLAEQNAFQSLEISDYAYVLETGHIALEGTGQELLADERVREAYLGVRQKAIE